MNKRGYKGSWSASIVFVGSVGLAATAFAQEGVIRAPVFDREDLEAGLARAEPPQLGPIRLDQQFNYNGLSLAFDEGTILDLPLQVGESQNTILRGSVATIGNVENSGALDFSSQGIRFNSRQSAWIFQLDTRDRQRIVTQRLDERGELLGFRLDLSVTGQCIFPGSAANDYCTYTPGLSTDPSMTDPDTLTPSAFMVSSEFGQIIPESVHQSLFAPGFQRGEDVPGGPLVGVAFDIQNSGFASDLDPSTLRGDRNVETTLRYVPTVARVEQTLSTNRDEAAATRTIRGFVLPDEDEIDSTYLAMQLGAWLLPSANENVAYLDGTPNTSVSNNLFLALNNARIPGDSYTIFQTGRASVVHPATTPQSAAETPVAQYTGFWMGMTPVRDVRVSQRLQFIPTGDRISVNDPAFDQGGTGTQFGDLLDAGITLINEIDQSVTSVNLQNIDDLFIQLGLDVTRQDAIRRITTTETTDYSLVPHLSFNGNRTGGETVWRYYTGVMFADENNAYVGTDFTVATESGWNAYARLDLYSEPNIDYKSEAELRGSRTFTINPDRQIVIGAGSVMELDNDMLGNGSSLFDDQAQADVFGRWREGNFDFTLSERFTRPNVESGWDRSTTLALGYSWDDRISVSAQATPWSTEDAYVEAALGLNVRLENFESKPVLQAQFARAKYEIGTSTFGDTATTAENEFRVGLQVQF
tara:strand:+ start:208 stop:2304 length:2097 start_codon:yes stop_codon:yes gene_type:complete